MTPGDSGRSAVRRRLSPWKRNLTCRGRQRGAEWILAGHQWSARGTTWASKENDDLNGAERPVAGGVQAETQRLWQRTPATSQAEEAGLNDTPVQGGAGVFIVVRAGTEFILFLLINLILGGGENEKKRERNTDMREKHKWLPLTRAWIGTEPTTQACVLVGN